MRFKLNGKVIQSGQNIDEVKCVIEEYNFRESSPEYGEEIILHGTTNLLDINHKVVIHIYFSKENRKLCHMVIHPLPIDFYKIQVYIEKQFGKPNNVNLLNNKQWKFGDKEITHCIVDRYGEEEMIFIKF